MMSNGIFTIILLLMLLVSSFHAKSEEVSKRDIVAAYLFNILKFTKFPPSKCKIKSFKVAIVKDRKIFLILLELQKILSLRGEYALQVIEYDSISSEMFSSSCMILYLSKDVSNVKNILKRIPDSILTISESESFLDNGGMINFVNIGQKLRWEVNMRALKYSGVKLDAQLLRAAIRIVKND